MVLDLNNSIKDEFYANSEMSVQEIVTAKIIDIN